MACSPPRLLCPWTSSDKNTGVGSHSLLQRIFPTQGLNPGLLFYRWILYHLSYQGSHCGVSQTAISYFHHSFYIYSLEFYCMRLHFIYLFMKLFIYMYMESWIYSLFHELLLLLLLFILLLKLSEIWPLGTPSMWILCFLIISSSFLGWEDPMEKEMASDSRILAWRIPWTEEPDGLQSMGSQKHTTEWLTHTNIHTHHFWALFLALQNLLYNLYFHCSSPKISQFSKEP